MARRRDRTTRRVTRTARKMGMSPTHALRAYDRDWRVNDGGLRANTGANRKLGRRGVRARARAMRMGQPVGGKLTNSP